jgi:dTDP-4-amino-4,6-dideoxygalactose transaminase
MENECKLNSQLIAYGQPMTLRFLDVRFTYEELREEIDHAFSRVLKSGTYIGGEEVSAFEAEFASYCHVSHCVGVGNGLDALTLALRALGIGRDDEVIVPAHTFIASWLAVTEAGARPVPVDADPDSMGMDIEQVEEAITERTKAIMPVHLYGIPVPMELLKKISQKYGLKLVADAAQAHGARMRGEVIGSMSHVAAFSFYPGKNLGAFGDAGAVATNSANLADRVRELANYGSTAKYVHESKGINSRLDPLQAAVLRAKLTRLQQWNERRREVAAVYEEALSDVTDLKLPRSPIGAEPVWHLYVVRHPRRDDLQKELSRKGIPTALHYPVAIHRSGAFKSEFKGQKFPVAEEISSTCLSLPIGPHLSLEDARLIADRVADSVAALR